VADGILWRYSVGEDQLKQIGAQYGGTASKYLMLAAFPHSLTQVNGMSLFPKYTLTFQHLQIGNGLTTWKFGMIFRHRLSDALCLSMPLSFDIF